VFLRDLYNLICKGDSVGIDHFPVAADFVCDVVRHANGDERVGKSLGDASPGVAKANDVIGD
jgi:hypothetical protein